MRGAMGRSVCARFADAWRGIAGPKDTPAAVVKLEDAIRKTVARPEFVKACDDLSVAPAFLPGAESGQVIAKEDSELALVVQTSGLKKSAN
jgi:tripartite-type tricarboxylate transporter receptor subunit TctC